MKVVFIRHLSTSGNEKKQYIGRTDEELSENAVKNFARASRYPRVQRVVASPLKRCVQTAELIYPGLEIEKEPMLKECDFGEYEGKTYEELKNEPEYVRWMETGGMTAFPGGEDQTEFRRRCADCVRMWIGRLLRENVESAAFVVHGGTIMAALSQLLEKPGEFYTWQAENGGGYIAEARADDWENKREILRSPQKLTLKEPGRQRDSIRIRPYRPSDCPGLARLFYDTVHTVNAADYTKEQRDTWADGNTDLIAWDESFREHLTLVAVEETALDSGGEDQRLSECGGADRSTASGDTRARRKKIVGFADMDRTGYLDRLYVHKDYQRMGIASALCGRLESAAETERFVTHASVTARPFFETRGYKVIKEQLVERKGVLLKNYVMEKRSGRRAPGRDETDIKIVPAYDHAEEIGELFSEYTEMLINGDPVFGEYLKIQGYEEELKDLEHKYGTPDGRLYLAYCGKTAAGCIGLKKLGENDCEMKRLYVKPGFRGKHIGAMLVGRIIEDARKIGYRRMYLDTVPFLESAVYIYKKFGFQETGCYNDSPVASSVYMSLDLQKA